MLRGEALSVDIGKEDVVQARGTVKETPQAPYGGKELVVSEIRVLGRVSKSLPVDPTGKTKADIDTRITYRFLDLRRDEVKKIFTAKSEAARAFREFLESKGFVEIHPPSIIGAASEGGAEVFEIQYFETKAYLAQSPQLYKQMAVVGGLERVSMVTPVFRAEKHATSYHLNEITAMDAEAAFFDDNDAIELLSGVLKHITKKLSKSYDEVEEVKEVKVVEYDDAVRELQENNLDIEHGDDFNRESEQKLCEVFGQAVVVKKWPTSIRAFYSMPYEHEPEYCRAFDLIYKGLEISSGAQRIHIPELLEEQIKKRGLDPESFSFYIDSFRYGAPPHSGWGMGLERLVMKMLGLKNIREAMLWPRDRVRLTP